MTERPILFSGELVRAILAGKKTQTRRPIANDWWRCLDSEDEDDRARAVGMCPFGAPGDHLWVRETFALIWPGESPPADVRQNIVEYRADKPEARYPGEWPDCPASARDDACPRWRPSIHMPRWASRLTLEVTGIRVERLQDITEADAHREGAALQAGSYVPSFEALWDAAYAKSASWSSNPWVWVISFKRVDGKEKAA